MREDQKGQAPVSPDITKEDRGRPEADLGIGTTISSKDHTLDMTNSKETVTEEEALSLALAVLQMDLIAPDSQADLETHDVEGNPIIEEGAGEEVPAVLDRTVVVEDVEDADDVIIATMNQTSMTGE